jgi:hypothetical protein
METAAALPPRCEIGFCGTLSQLYVRKAGGSGSISTGTTVKAGSLMGGSSMYG